MGKAKVWTAEEAYGSSLLPDTEVALARQGNPDTSWDAVAKVNANHYEMVILNWLAAHGDGTILEVQQSTGEAMQSISPRFATLRRKLLVETNGKRENTTGVKALLWRLTARGHDFLGQRFLESL